MTDREYLEKYLDKEKQEDGIERLEKGEPVQYIVGNVDFYGSLLEVNKNVLIPRFETELLVEKSIAYIKKYLQEDLHIVDIGTGSGAIAIALKKEFPQSKVDAVDISKEALTVALKNAEKNKVSISFYKGNLLDPLLSKEKYDILISNPPYIDREEEIMEIVRKNEPDLALYADHHGLACYEEILKKAPLIMKEKCLLAFEIGYKQGPAIRNIARTYFKDSLIFIEKDLALRDRFVFILQGVN